jgi:hypothetical protein
MGLRKIDGQSQYQEDSFMTLGPLEYIVIGFEGNRFDGSIAREIEKVVASKTISLVDVVFIGRADNGDAVVLELDNKDDPRFASFAGLLGDRMALFTEEDVMEIAETLPPNTSGLAILFEHRWAVEIKEAMSAAGGFLVTRTVVPAEVVEEVAAELEGASAAV